MPDPITVSEETQWAADIAGDNDDRFQALASHENLNAFVDHHFDEQSKDWRAPYIGDEFLTEEQMGRFATPGDLAKSYAGAQTQLSKGFQAPTLPENATDEDVAAFRTAQGIPLKAGDYLENLPDGLVIGEADAAIAEHFTNKFHEMNASPAVVHGILGAYNEWAEQQQADLAEMDTGHFKEVEDVLRAPVEEGGWGPEYRANVNIVGAMLDKTFGKEAAEAIQNARGPDGRAIMNTPAILAGMAQLARELDPLVTIIPNDTGDSAKTLNDEIAAIEKVMKDDRPAYNKDEKMQARLLELYDIRLKHEAAA